MYRPEIGEMIIACSVERYINLCNSNAYVLGYPTWFLFGAETNTIAAVVKTYGQTYAICDKISEDDYYGLSMYDGSRHRLSAIFIERLPFKTQLKALL